MFNKAYQLEFFSEYLRFPELLDWLVSLSWVPQFLPESVFMLTVCYLYAFPVWIISYYGKFKPEFFDESEKEWYTSTIGIMGIIFAPIIALLEFLSFKGE